MNFDEIVCSDGCVVKDGILDGTSGAIYFYWHMDAEYNYDIARGMNDKIFILQEPILEKLNRILATL